MADKFRYSKIPTDDDARRQQRETEDNFFSKDKNGNLVLNKDIYAHSLYLDGDSLYIGGIKFRAPIHSNNDGFWKYDRENKEFILSTAAGEDTTAIHDDEAGEISLVPEKVTPISGDFILIEDSADSNNKKRVQVGNLPSTSNDFFNASA